jgi:hypothetical protein
MIAYPLKSGGAVLPKELPLLWKLILIYTYAE